MENIINKHFQNVLIAQDLKANVQTIGRIVRNEILLDSDPENAEKVDTIFATNRQFIDELLNEPDISQSNNLQLVLEISQLLEDYYTVVENSLFSPYCDLEIKLIEKICDAIGITMNRILDQVSLEDIVLFVKRQFTPLARNKKLDFEVKLEPTVPTLLLTDEHRLKQILNNLLANAFKFTEEGKIKLHIKVNDERTKVIFAISDTGIGISKNKLTRIFEDFYQADSTTSRKYGGTGLGLPISKELAHLLNGEIKVESVEGKGSTFSLYIGNIDAADFTDLIEEKSFSHSELVSTTEPKEILVTTNEVEQNNELQNKVVLIVDDDMRNVFALTAALEKKQLQTVFAENGKEALQILAQNEQIDIVLMDIMMPEMNGYETMREIRKQERYKDLPIIALTAKAMKSDREKCIEAGASDYISKPVNIEQLISLMKVWLYKLK